MTPPARVCALLLTTLVGLFLIACEPAPSNTPGGSPGSPGPSASAGPTDVPGASSSGEAGQTDTEWGRIWDTLPANFPTPADAIDADPIDRGPTSGDFSIGAAPEDIKSFYDSALGTAGYVSSVQGPLENGAYVLDSASMVAGCQVQVTITPLSGVTHVTVLFGAACPFG
jgi:hypothetical protein